jgi:hypothetical protein
MIGIDNDNITFYFIIRRLIPKPINFQFTQEIRGKIKYLKLDDFRLF